MDVKTLISLAVQGSMMLIVLAVGLRSRWRDLTFALGQPRLLLSGLVAVNAVVPTVAILLCLLLPGPVPVEAGLVIMAVSPLAPFAPGKMMKACPDTSYVVGLYAALVLASVVIVPITAMALTKAFGRDLTLPIADIAQLVVTSILLPLAVGVSIATLAPNFARRVAPIATMIAYLVLLPVFALFLYASGAKLLALLGTGTLLIIPGTILSAFVAGHLLGGSVPEHRLALAQAAAVRHPGIAGLIAHRHFDNPQVMLAVILFLILGMVMAPIYTRWMSSKYEAQRLVAPA